ncbi:P-loop containing nucleoside triphosphate hydrolase protein [Xylariales sp. PMI_506]|nr:P-loop containing nucleoside triphosphate hydrolase protein [Xylariales sp. PMI_506]
MTAATSSEQLKIPGELPPTTCETSHQAQTSQVLKQEVPFKLPLVFAFTGQNHAALLALGLVTALLVAAIKTSLAILLGRIFTAVSKFGDGSLSGTAAISQVSSWCVVIVAIGGVSWLVNFAFVFLWMARGELQARQAHEEVFHALLHKDMSWYDCQPEWPGGFIVQMQTQLGELRAATSFVFGNLAVSIITSTANLVVGLYCSWRLTLVILATLPISMAILGVLNRNLPQAVQFRRTELAAASKSAFSATEFIDIVKALNGADQEIWQYTASVRRASRWDRVQFIVDAYQLSYVRFWMESLFVIGFYYGSILINDGTRVGDVVTTFYAALGTLQAVESLMTHCPALTKGISAAKTLRKITDLGRGKTFDNGEVLNLKPERCFGEVQVKFAYPSNPSKVVLHNVSLSFPVGKTCFIIGPNGSGKSTLGDLLVRLYNPQAGEILIDTHAIHKLDPTWIRNNITLVQQWDHIFNETAHTNIILGHPDASQVPASQILRACQSVLLRSTIDKLPQGLETYLGQATHNMSGGEKRRISIARAKLRDTQILILDEITNGLSPTDRSSILNMIREWRRDKTTIIITHELRHIEEKDYVFVMNHGRVVEEGYKEELAEDPNSMFNTMLHSDLQGMTTSHQTGCMNMDKSSILFEDNSIGAPTPSISSALPLGFSLYSTMFSPTSPSYFPIRAISKAEPSYSEAPEPGTECLSKPKTPSLSRSGRGHLNSSSQLTEYEGADGSQAASSYQTNDEKLPSQPNSSRIWPLGISYILGQAGLQNMLKGTKPINEGPTLSGSLLEHAQQYQPPEAGRAAISLWMIYKTVWSHTRTRQRVILIVGLLSCVLVAASLPLFSVIFANLLCALYQSNPTAAGREWAIILSLVAAAGSITTFISRYLMDLAGQAWVDALRAEAFSRILQQPPAFFEGPTHSPSLITESLDGHIDEVRGLVSCFATGLVMIVVMVLTNVLWAALISWKLTFVTVAGGFSLVVTTKGYAATSSKWEVRRSAAEEHATAVVVEAVTGIRIVRALVLEQHFITKHSKSVARTYKIGLQKAVRMAALYACWQTVSWSMMALIFYYATYLLTAEDEVPVSSMLKVINLLILGLSAAGATVEALPSLGSARAAAEKLLYYASLSLENDCVGLDSCPGSTPIQGCRQKRERRERNTITTPFPIRMDGLSFSYPSQLGDPGPPQPVLRHITLEINPGTTTAVVGPSGSGKSTLLSFLPLLRTPAPIPAVRNVRPRGSRHPLSFAGGLAPAQLDPDSLRRHIGYVGQQPRLFSGSSVGANLTYGLPEASPLRRRGNLERAAAEAGVLELVRSLPEGFETIIGEGGGGGVGGHGESRLAALSGGQAQRLCIARALVRRPRVLVLDEPTSALDPQCAEAVRAVVTGLIQGDVWARDPEDVAVILSTHSVDMMKVVDRIVFLQDGKIAEVGTFEELIRRKDGQFGAFIGDDECARARSVSDGSDGACRYSSRV